MNRRLTAVLLVIVAVFAGVSAKSAALKDPKAIIKKAKDRALSLNSYSYTYIKEGWDFEMDKTAEQTKSVAGDVAKNPLAKKYSNQVNEVDTSKAKFMKYNVDIKFMKPYSVQMKITQSDYVPSLLKDAVLTFRSDKDDKVFYVKPRISPLGIKRAIDSASGNFLYTPLFINFMKIDGLMKDAAPVLEGTAKVDGRNAYKIAFNFPGAKDPKRHPVDYDKWNIPKSVQWKYKEEIDEFARGNVGKVVYFFDVDTFDLLRSDCLQKNGKEYFHKEWKNFKTNNLSESDF
ncbi:MAG TPA: hypothetical protein PLQ76_02000 [bacterium]|nr:hypothetical protein [bacterium]